MTIESICNSINGLIKTVRKPLNKVPAILLTCGAINRPGLSPMLIASNIIRRQPEAGAIPGPSPNGYANISEAMERIRVEEIVNAIKSDMKIEIGIPIGGIQIQATGANAGGPVEVVGFNINPVHGDGVAR